MSSSAVLKSVWLGYARLGGRLYLKHDEMQPGINVLGPGANAIASVIAYACHEAGLRTLVLDLSGKVSGEVSGHVDCSDYGYFLYDAMRLEDEASLHGELVASAYTVALNLSFEQEAFLNSASQTIALEHGVVSPSSLSDQLNQAGEFRGHTADELRSKLGSLRSLNLVGETDVVKKMLAGSAIARFAGAESSQAAELALLIFLAKVLAISKSGVQLPDVIIINDANRIFSNLPVARHSNRILVSLISARTSRILVSDATYGLDHHFIETSPTRIYSSALWNEIGVGKFSPAGLYSQQHVPRGVRPTGNPALILTSNMFMLQDATLGYEEAFVPRPFEAATGETRKGESAPREDNRLTKEIFEAVGTHALATRASVVSYLSLDRPREEVERAVEKLLSQGYLTTVATDARRDSPLHSLRLTESGKEFVRRLS